MVKKKKKFSSLEKKAFYTGFGVGLVGRGPSSERDTRRAYALMSDKEKASYLNGYERGLDNIDVVTGIRNRKRWFR